MDPHTDIQPFRIEIPASAVRDLQRRIGETRWPKSPVADWSRGVPPGYLRELAGYWGRQFDWRAQEARLNQLPQYTTAIDGQTIHFVHARSPEPEATPLLLTHGWPSSFVEFEKVIGPLADPRRHGGSAAPAFHVIVPTLPGFGFSSALPAGGNLFHVASAWAKLMTQLGYERFVAHGGDIGAGVTGMLPMVAPGRVAALHITGPSLFPFGPAIDPAGLSPRDAERAARLNAFREEGTGYLRIQATRPQTLGYGLNDSPVAQLAWIVEKFAEWTDPGKPLPHEAVDRDQLLALVSLCWFTESGASSAHFSYDGMKAFAARAAAVGDAGLVQPNAPPLGVSVFAGDFSIRALLDPQGLAASWTEYDRGGHFPAMEAPELLVSELRQFFRDRGARSSPALA